MVDEMMIKTMDDEARGEQKKKKKKNQTVCPIGAFELTTRLSHTKCVDLIRRAS